MVLLKEMQKTKDGVNNINSIELSYSWFMFLSGNHRWFCRIWNTNDGFSLSKIMSESYGKTKFQAYKNALEIHNNKFTKKTVR